MRLFRRKPTMDIDDLRCPRCTERVPEGATECDMCGLDLRPLRSGATTARTNEVRDRGCSLPPDVNRVEARHPVNAIAVQAAFRADPNRDAHDLAAAG